ncbi:Mu-like prophage major head subunit gpT family protein [Achromobacter seleniivolatilans]|uniref:Mu-like prophage major head subunit gpT family protein n=1 Tax=Achromobacter seleniivolatilans TaxID=3047478 RepID=A0ABY9M8C1_9BURK|nr:Mu-like prophage major head subunit gpT family protein [Achromobacter sp. R39]WMD23095.1 Mu-like prophage major head subunit gpT family protein [Achromobacter sp. R39]
MIINPQNLQALFQGFKLAFSQAFEGAPSAWAQLATPIPSTTGEEAYPWLGQSTQFREWVGERVYQNLKMHGYRIKNKTFENTVAVDRDSIEDDQYGVFTPLMAQLGQDAKEHPDLLIFELLKSAFSTACYDGQYFFDTDHPVGKEGATQSVSNFQGGSGRPWFLLDTSRVIKPLILQKRREYDFVAKTDVKDTNVFDKNEFVYGVDGRLNVGFSLWQLAYASREPLDGSAFNDAHAEMSSFKGDHGKPLGIRPKLLVVGPQDRAAALEVVKAERSANGATNINRDVVDVLTTPWLA